MAERTKPTIKQARFARAYVVEGNATEAVVQAGYKVKSRKVARTIGVQNLAKLPIQREIESWQARLERQIVPSLKTIEDLRDQSADDRIKLAASRDLLNRAGVGKQNEAPKSVVAVFSSMNESLLLEKMAQLTGQKLADASDKIIDASPNIDCATQDKKEPENRDGVGGSDSGTN